MRPLLAAVLALGFILSSTPTRAVDTQGDNNPDLTGIRAMIKAKDYAGALPLLRNLADKGNNANVFNLLAFCLRKTGDFKTAHTYYQKALDFDPDLKSAREYLGELYVQTGQMDKAREQLAVLTRLCPSGCEELDDLKEAIDKGRPKQD